ncbi:MAG: putative Ntn-hydrolase superfamily protein, partial [Natrialbaceae archaeon]
MPPRPATFSIVARDPETDAVGVAVHSKFISVGSVVPFASADAGAIATQSFANVAYGPDGLDHLREGKPASETVDALVEADDEAPQRQVGIIGQDGSVAAFTGEECFDVAGDIQGETYTVQGNILENRETLEAMAEAYETTDGGLPEQLLAALHAGNDAGGDQRGEQSAAMYVVKPEGGYDGKNDRWIDVRVDDHENPIDELERVFRLYDVTLLEREEPDDLGVLEGDTAEAVLETLADLEFYDGTPGPDFGEDEHEALESFRGMNNFENHDLAVIEDALARGWDDADGDGEARMVNA